MYVSIIKENIRKWISPYQQAIKSQNWVEVYSFFNFDGKYGVVVKATPLSALHQGKRHNTYCTGSWVVPMAGFDGNIKSTGIRSPDRP
jgi:hypothetical protein